jgi:hypothetical protein
MSVLSRKRRLVTFGGAFLIAASLSAQERPLPEREAFLAEVRTRLQSDQSVQGRYSYIETRRDRKLDENGRPSEESVKVFENHPGLPGEGRWERLIVEDGKPVSPEALEKEDREREEKAREIARRMATASPPEHARQRRAWEKDQREKAKAVDDVFRVYDIRMLGRERMNGHDTIRFSLTPRADADPRTDDGEIMTHFKVRAWISETDYELVRVEAEAIETVSNAFVLISSVHPGARFSFARRKIDGEAWLPALSSYSGSARVGLVKVIRRSSTSEFSDYQREDESASAAVR